MRSIFAIALFFCVLSCSSLLAQQTFKGWPVSPKVAEDEGKKEKAVTAALQSGNVDRALFGNYFNRYYFHRWTLMENATRLSTFVRRDFLGRDMKNATGSARTFLLGGTLQMMKRMKSDANVYPAARLNAVVVLGLLYEDKGETRLYQAALPVLMEEFMNPQSPDYNKIAALDGIIRFSYVGIADQQLRNIRVPQILLKLAKEAKSETVQDQEIYLHFYRVKAIEGLSSILLQANKASASELPPSLASVLETLLTIIENEDEPNAVRYAAASSLAQAHMPQLAKNNVKLDSARIAGAIMLLAKHACIGETEFVKNAQRFEQVSLTTSGGGRGMGGPSMGGGYGGGLGDSMSEYGGGMSGYGGVSIGNPKSENRIKQCIGSSKYAFNTIRDVIRGKAATRNEGGLLALLDTETAPEKAAVAKLQRETLNKINTEIDDYFKFLDNGPTITGVAGQTNRRMMPLTSGGVSGGGKKRTPQTGSSAPKVTMQNIIDQLTLMSTKLEDIISEATPKELATTSQPASF